MTIPMDDFLKLQQRVEKLEKRQQDIKMTDEGYTFLPLYAYGANCIDLFIAS